jgi:ribosomal protein S18 acetylase RimI-like enzyme
MEKNSGIQISIRQFQDADHDAVIQLWNEVFPDDPPWNAPHEMIRRKREVKDDLFWVAESDENIVGTILAGFDGVRGWIYHLGVPSSMRRHGIASKLMDAAERKLEELGCVKINLQIRMDNMAVQAFYERLGYQVEHRVQMGKPIGKYRSRGKT